MTEPLLTVQEVAAHVGLSEYTVRQAIRAGELPATKLRRRLRIDPADLAAWIEAGMVRAPTQRLSRPMPPIGTLGISRGVTATAANVDELIAQARRKRKP